MRVKSLIKLVRKAYYIGLCKIFYPSCSWLISWDPLSIRGYAFFQRILNVNGARLIPWPVHFTSRVTGNVTVGSMTAPGMMPGCYINGMAGIHLGGNVWIGPGVKIISANHDPGNLKQHLPAKSITIGNNVWIGANAIILPEVNVGDNVIVGAGTVLTRSVPAGMVVAGNPAKIIKENLPKVQST